MEKRLTAFPFCILVFLRGIKFHFIPRKNCIKLKLKANQVFENKEIFKVDPKALKIVIDNCYCKYVSSKKNEEMYEDISHLLGLYAYTKDKIHIKPYVVIGKNL